MRRRPVTVALLLAIALLCAGCGSEGATSGAGAAKTASGSGSGGRTQASDVLGLRAIANGVFEVQAADPTTTLHDLTSWAVHHGVALGDLTVARPSLEDTYLALIEPPVAEQEVLTDV